MKRLVVLAVCAVILLGLTGCQGNCGKDGKSAGQSKAVFPPEVAGTWKQYDGPWKIVLSPDGKVVSAVIATGEVELGPNQTKKIEMSDGNSISTYESGDFDAAYNPVTRELSVSVEMKAMHIRFNGQAIDGNTSDSFIGPVSEDGKLWTANRINVFNFGPLFPQDPNDIGTDEPLTFEKVKN